MAEVLPRVESAQWTAIGTRILVAVTEPKALDTARLLVEEDLLALDLACSRFRSDSEVIGIERSAGAPASVGPILGGAIAAALDAAAATDGDLDPTLGRAIESIGYDRDIALVAADGPPVAVTVGYRSSWRQVELDLVASTVTIPRGIRLDLGATAKAWAADRSAGRLGEALGCGALVSFGGDISTAGPPPPGGWTIRVQEVTGDPSGPAPDGACTVAIQSGGLATSSTMARRWQRGGVPMHHILDPGTGLPAAEVWRTVSVAAPTALAANVASTTSIIRGERAHAWLASLGFPARLVRASGEVATVGGWPTEDAG